MEDAGEARTCEKPRNHTVSELKRVNVEWVGMRHLRCTDCGAMWSPNLRSGGRLPQRYWWCPNGCNNEGRARIRESFKTPIES